MTRVVNWMMMTRGKFMVMVRYNTYKITIIARVAIDLPNVRMPEIAYINIS